MVSRSPPPLTHYKSVQLKDEDSDKQNFLFLNPIKKAPLEVNNFCLNGNRDNR